MTEARMSYLRSFTAQDYYQSEPGLFRGTLNGGFLVSLLLRLRRPGLVTGGGALIEDNGVLIGNFEPSAAVIAEGSGWRVRYFQEIDDLNINFDFADAANVVQTVTAVAGMNDNGAMNRRTFLLNYAFGLNSSLAAQSLYTWVNGELLVPPIAIASYAPAPVTNRFAVGTGQTSFFPAPPLDLPAQSADIAGFSFRNGLPGANSAADDVSLGLVQDIVDQQWATVLESLACQDDSDDNSLGELWDVRRGLPEPADTWESSQGGANVLSRVGSASLETLGARAYFYGGWIASSIP